MTRKRMRNLAIISLLAGNSLTAIAQNHYGFRGPSRSGNYPETGLLKKWAEGGPELLWETLDAGKGYSSPVIYENGIYVTGMSEEGTKEIFSAYSLDGKRKYRVEYGAPWDKSYPETRTTPTIVAGKAFLISGSGEVICLDISNGTTLWKVEAGKEFGAVPGRWGTAECPLVYDNKVIYTPGGEQTSMVAFNTANGEVAWKTKSLSSAGCYVSPILITHKGKKQIVGSTDKHVFGVNPSTGAIEWEFAEWGAPEGARGGQGGNRPQGERPQGERPQGERQNAERPQGERPQAEGNRQAPQGGQRGGGARMNNAINMPIYHEGKIFFSQGYSIGSYLLELNDDATAVKQVWKNADLDTHMGGQVLVNGLIFGSSHSNNANNWLAVDWNTGETKYNTTWSGGKGKGSIVSADGMLYCYDDRRGVIGLVNPSTEHFDVVSELRITKGEGPHWSHLVIDKGILYVRHGEALMAYKIK